MLRKPLAGGTGMQVVCVFFQVQHGIRTREMHTLAKLPRRRDGSLPGLERATAASRGQDQFCTSETL